MSLSDVNLNENCEYFRPDAGILWPQSLGSVIYRETNKKRVGDSLCIDSATNDTSDSDVVGSRVLQKSKLDV